MRRTREQQRQAPVDNVAVGDKDPMSLLARKVGLPLCGDQRPTSPLTCTRVAGHSEGEGRGHTADHPSRKHVAAGQDNIAKKVWM